MIFSSIPFLILFLPIFLIIYYLVPFKMKNIILLIFSLIFYSWGEPIYILLMIFSSVVDYINGKMIEKSKNHKKHYLIFSIIVNLCVLGFFKYADFLIEIINSTLNLNIHTLNLGLPIGISFFTFQTMSYSIDVYNKKVKAETNFLNFMTYVSMFPQLIAGPIVRYEDISRELHKREINFNNVVNGFLRFLKGMFKKVLIANNMGYLFSLITNDISNISVLTSWLAILAFAFQVFFDFSGYSDMAIGLGKMLGFNYLENFNFPYISKSITEFWRRWHISLSSWFRDYVYIPLGGSRTNLIKNIRNILIVWFLTGLWHGASMNYILWGLYFGVILLIEKFILKKYIDKLPNFFKHLYAIILILIGWTIFAFEDFTILKNFMGIMFGNAQFIDNDFIYYLSNYFLLILISILFSIPVFNSIIENIKNEKIKKTTIALGYLILFIISLSYLVSDSYNPFLYFRF